MPDCLPIFMGRALERPMATLFAPVSLQCIAPVACRCAVGGREPGRRLGAGNHPFGHGHNYVLEVTLSGPVDPVTGMVVDLGDLDLFAQREVIDLF